jgi:hypothetical protein
MKKNVFSLYIRIALTIIIVLCFSCWSPFEPVTHIGKDVVSTLDSNVTNMKGGFKVLDGMDLVVTGEHNVTSLGPDTSTYRFVSGVHSGLFTAGSAVGERSFAYTQIFTYYLRNPSVGIYQKLIVSPDSTVDKAYLEIHYYPLYTDTNGTVDHIGRFGVYSCPGKNPAGALLDTNPENATFLFPPESRYVRTYQMHSKTADTFEVPIDAKSLALINKAIHDTATDSTKYDTIGFYIKSLDTTGLFHFSAPSVKLHFKTSKTDTTAHDSTVFSTTYFDISVFDTRPADTSLVASWEADRFIEIPISLKPLWDSVKIGSAGEEFRIVQTASCSLFTQHSLFEAGDTADTIRTLAYGLLDHSITDPAKGFPLAGSKTLTNTVRDSFITFLNQGLIAVDTVYKSPTNLSLSMTMYLQRLADEETRPETAYLYIFVRPEWHFGRVVLKNTPTVKFSALFSNPHK